MLTGPPPKFHGTRDILTGIGPTTTAALASPASPRSHVLRRSLGAAQHHRRY